MKPSVGGTAQYSRHLQKHEKSATTGSIQEDLSARCRRNVIEAAALAVILDLRPLGFADNKPGIAAFATALFKAGQSVPAGININPKSYVPSRSAVTEALSKTAKEMRSRFKEELHETLIASGGAVTIDGVTLKLQGRHYYDFTLDTVRVSRSNRILDPPRFGIKTHTILFVEGPDVPNANNIKDMLDTNLRRDYGISFDTMHTKFTFVTDGAAVMAKMAGSSISTNIATPDERWMRCLVHVLHNNMKAVIKDNYDDDIMTKIQDDFVSMKKIVENAKKEGWNSALPKGYHLIQEVETRFGTHYAVAERFLKSRLKVWAHISSQNNTTAKKWYDSLSQDNEGRFVTIEAITDAFKPVYDLTIIFQAAEIPTLHKILPALQYCDDELLCIERGEFIMRDGHSKVRPSTYSTHLSKYMRLQMKKIEVHDLWLVGCFLHPYLRDFAFWRDAHQRKDFKMRGETLARTLYEKEIGQTGSHNNDGVVLNPTQHRHSTSEPPAKRGKFSLKNYMTNHVAAQIDMNEVTRYLWTPLSSMGLNQDPFDDDAFAVVKFWHNRRNAYPLLYKIALRVYATPASSSTSERVFSALNNLVTAHRATLTPKHISELIVARSLYNSDN